MNDRVTESFDDLLHQASMTADTYMSSAIREIDAAFGASHVKANPALVAAFMQAASSDFVAASNTKVYGSALDRIADSLDGVAHALRDQD